MVVVGNTSRSEVAGSTSTRVNTSKVFQHLRVPWLTTCNDKSLALIEMACRSVGLEDVEAQPGGPSLAHKHLDLIKALPPSPLPRKAEST